MSFTPVGWDGWETLCAWDVPTLAGSTAEAIEAIHVIVEGAGAGEVRSTLGAYKQARRAGELVPTIGVEPVMHEVSEASLDGLSDVTRVATACSPCLLGHLIDPCILPTPLRILVMCFLVPNPEMRGCWTRDMDAPPSIHAASQAYTPRF